MFESVAKQIKNEAYRFDFAFCDFIICHWEDNDYLSRRYRRAVGSWCVGKISEGGSWLVYKPHRLRARFKWVSNRWQKSSQKLEANEFDQKLCQQPRRSHELGPCNHRWVFAVSFEFSPATVDQVSGPFNRTHCTYNLRTLNQTPVSFF